MSVYMSWYIYIIYMYIYIEYLEIKHFYFMPLISVFVLVIIGFACMSVTWYSGKNTIELNILLIYYLNLMSNFQGWLNYNKVEIHNYTLSTH